MVDNVLLNSGSGGETMATDDDGTAHHQYVKIEFGADNTQTKVASGAGLPVTPDSGGFAITNAGTFVVQEDGAALTALQLIDDTVYVDDADWTALTSKHILIGGVYSAVDRTVTDGDTVPIAVDMNGHTIVSSHAESLALADNISNTVNIEADHSGGFIATAVFGFNYDGSTWDRVRGDATNGLLVNLGANNDVSISGTVTVDATGQGDVPVTLGGEVVILGAGTAGIGKLTANSGVDIGDVDVLSLPNITNGGTFVVQEDGAALTALQLIDNTIFVDDAAFTLTSSSVSIAGAIRDDQLVTLSAAEGDAVPLRVTHDGKLHTKAEIFDPGTIDGFGHLITGEYSNQVDIQFFRDTPANLTTVTVATGGATSQVGGSGKWETSTAGTASAKSVTTQKTSYRSGSDIFALFTAAYTVGVANSFQRIGLYDTNDGFFFGYEGTSFGVTIRNAASDTTTASGSFSDDTLTGAVGSLFTRAGTPEAIDPTKLNVFRVRFGWLGSGPVHFEVLSPDDHWVTFHKILQPNLAAIASIENPDLPVTLHVDKNGADGTNIIMISSCWGAGISTGALPLDETLTDDVLAKINRNVIVGKTAGGAYVNVQTTNSGNLKIALDEYDGVPVGGGVELGALRVTIANDSTGIITANAGTDLNTSSLLTTSAHDAAFGTAGSADAQVRTIQGVASMTPLLVDATGSGDVPITLAGEVVVLGAGTAGIGKLTANSGVDIGDVDVTSISAGANLIGDVGLSGARTSGGTSIFRSIDLDEGALEVIKASAGQIYWIHAINLSAVMLFVKIYNATSGTYGTGTPVLTFPIPTQGDTNGAGFTIAIPNGIAFATGISIGAGTGVADNDTGAPGANDCVVNIGFA